MLSNIELMIKNKHSSQVSGRFINLNLKIRLAAEKTEAITQISISKGGKYICVCHRSIGKNKGVF